jgi:Family of unknown function (DUF5343)
VAAQYPYVSGTGSLVKAFDQFRKSFPQTLDAEALQKFGIAPANETYVINTFRFLGLIDDEGKRIESATDFFFHGDEAFAKGLEQVVMQAYGALFSDFGGGAWEESKDSLTQWFRVSDKTSDLVGGRQAGTFIILAALSGHGEVKRSATSKTSASGSSKSTGSAKATAPAKQTTPAKDTKTASPSPAVAAVPVATPGSDLGLSVRIEVNLPASGSADTYDAIFASIRKHLIDRE